MPERIARKTLMAPSHPAALSAASLVAQVHLCGHDQTCLHAACPSAHELQVFLEFHPSVVPLFLQMPINAEDAAQGA